MFGIVDPLGAFRTIGIIQVAETQDEGGILVKDFLPKQYKCIEAHLKALLIIKEKGIILQFIKETYTVEQYNAAVEGTLVKKLTQEEYNLLKEVLTDE